MKTLFNLLVTCLSLTGSLLYSSQQVRMNDEFVFTQIGQAKILLYSNSQIGEIINPFLDKVENQYFLTFSKPFPLYSNMGNLTFFAYTDNNKYAKDYLELNNTLMNFSHLVQTSLKLPFYCESGNFHFIVNQDHSGLFLKTADITELKVCPQKKEVSFFENHFIFDWQMASSTIGGELFHDETSGNRFILKVQPGESRGILKIYQHPPFSSERNQNQQNFENVTTIPYSFFAPIDCFGPGAVGSWKGKMLAFLTKGVVEQKELSCLFNKGSFVPVNDIKQAKDGSQKILFRVSNSQNHPLNTMVRGYMMIENLSMLTLDPSDYSLFVDELKKQLGLNKNLLQLYRVIKRDSGFSRFDQLPIYDAPHATAVLINRSVAPNGYDYYNISEDLSASGLPLIQLYQFRPEFILILPIQSLKQLLLTPTDEFLYRQILQHPFREATCTPRLHTELDILIFN